MPENADLNETIVVGIVPANDSAEQVFSKTALRPSPSPFNKPFKLTKCAGLLALVAMLLVLAIPGGAVGLVLCLTNVLPESYGTHVLYLAPAVWLLALYLLFLYSYTRRWKKYFAHLPDECSKKHISENTCPFEEPGAPKEVKVSMRPTKIYLKGYLWCMHAIYPMFMFSVVCMKLPYMFMVKKAHQWGWLNKADPGPVLAEMYLETTAGIGFFKEIVQEGGRVLAVFHSEYFDPVLFPLVGGGLGEFNRLETKIDVKTRDVVSSTLDGAPISTEKALLLIIHLMGWQIHAWIHSLAMWGCDQDHKVPWTAKMSRCSYYFNHLGGDGGVGVFCKTLGVDWDPLDYSDKVPVQRPRRPYERLRELLPYSRFSAFLYHGHEAFLKMLQEPEYFKSFCRPHADLDDEGHFIVTAVHSLDHWQLNRIFSQAGRFALFKYEGPPAKTGDLDYHAIGRLCFTLLALSDDWPKIFDVYLRQATHPFYRRFYEEASKLDGELAWHMQGCMIK